MVKKVNTYLGFVLLGFVQFLGGQNIHSVLKSDGTFGAVNANEPSIAFFKNQSEVGIIGVNTSWVFLTNDPFMNSWTPVVVNPPQGFYGDPVFKISNQGVVYLAHLAKNKSGVWPKFFDRIVFERSEDSGKTFTSTDVGFHEGKMQDKPWFSMDEWQGSKGYGNVYLSWTEFDDYGSKESKDSSRIWFVRSVDGGRNFETPVVISDVSGDAQDDDGTAEGANVAISPDGVLHAVWSRNDTIWYDCSRDRGKTWGKDQFVARQIGGWNHSGVRSTMRVNGMPVIQSDAFGNIYVAYSGDACEHGLTTHWECMQRNVFLSVLRKGKSEFNEPIVLNRPASVESFYAKGSDGLSGDIAIPLFEFTEQYSPAMVVSPNGKRLFVAWQDRRRSQTGCFFDVYGVEIVASKRGELKLGNNVRLSNNVSIAPGTEVFMGDYISLDWAESLHLAYTAFSIKEKHPIICLSKFKESKRVGSRFLIQGEVGISTPALEVAIQRDKQQASSTLDALTNESMKKIDGRQIALWAAWPEAKSFTVEFKLGKQVMFEHVFENVKDGHVDLLIPASRFTPGMYEIVLRKKGKMVKQPFYFN